MFSTEKALGDPGQALVPLGFTMDGIGQDALSQGGGSQEGLSFLASKDAKGSGSPLLDTSPVGCLMFLEKNTSMLRSGPGCNHLALPHGEPAGWRAHDICEIRHISWMTAPGLLVEIQKPALSAVQLGGRGCAVTKFPLYFGLTLSLLLPNLPLATSGKM